MDVGVNRFGVGGLVRCGEWFGVRVKVKDNGTVPQRRVLVVVQGIDPDGDIPQYSRDSTLNQGVEQTVWLYARLPFRYNNEPITISVFEAEEGATTPSGQPGFRPGALVGQASITPQQAGVLRPEEGMIALLGEDNRTFGLVKYSDVDGTAFQGREVWHTRGHEVTRIASGLTPDEMPDRWIGLAPFDAVVWGSGEPSSLDGDRAAAIRDYVSRGGHLIIILPEASAQAWTNTLSNRLHDIMPVVSVARNDGVDLAPYRPLVNVRRAARYPTKPGTVYTFRTNPDAGAGEAIPILNGPDGRAVVVRRLVGAGAVSLIGLNINDTALAQGDGLDTDVFWHRILGRRGALGKVESTRPGGPVTFGGGRQPIFFDRGIPEQIAKKGDTVLGVFVGFLVFVAYWLVAGPVGYHYLRSRGYQRHAWVGFLAGTGVFTAVAWGGATLLRSHTTDAKHVTILDHVYGQPIQRARMWASVMLPVYGDKQLSVGDPALGETLCSITTWDAPGTDESWGGFTDARPYVIDARDPDVMTVPARATVKNIQADWAGGPQWQMPIPVGPDGTGAGSITINPDHWPAGNNPVLSGTLVHNLPGKLTNVTIIVVKRQLDLQRPAIGATPSSSPLAHAFACAATGLDWRRGEPLDLAVATARVSGASAGTRSTLELWIDGLLPSVRSDINAMNPLGETDVRTLRVDEALALYPMLDPPSSDPDNSRVEAVALRRATHGWDLGRWFTQPCVIVLGRLESDGADAGVPSPVPLMVDGKAIPALGVTTIRWVYPLPADPPGFPSETDPGGLTPGAGGPPPGQGGPG